MGLFILNLREAVMMSSHQPDIEGVNRVIIIIYGGMILVYPVLWIAANV